MKIRFLTSGESPDFGEFTEKQEREDLPREVAQVLVDRGVAEEVKSARRPVPTGSGNSKSEMKQED